jgi:hypothetical protein
MFLPLEAHPFHPFVSWESRQLADKGCGSRGHSDDSFSNGTSLEYAVLGWEDGVRSELETAEGRDYRDRSTRTRLVCLWLVADSATAVGSVMARSSWERCQLLS